MAALSDGTVTLDGVLFSDDSRHFISSLTALGFDVLVEEEKRRVMVKGESGTIPKKEAEIDVGSAGTAARFLTAMLGMSDGSYVIQASGQMKKRPMKDLFVLLEQTGAEICTDEFTNCCRKADCAIIGWNPVASNMDTNRCFIFISYLFYI